MRFLFPSTRSHVDQRSPDAATAVNLMSEEQHMGSGRQQAGGSQHSSPRRRAECISLVPAAARASLAASLPASPERPRPTSAPAQHDLEELQRRLAAEQERTTKATAHESGAQVGAQPRGLAAAAPKRRAVSPPQQQQQQQQHARMYASAPYTPPPPIQPPLSPGLHGCGVCCACNVTQGATRSMFAARSMSAHVSVAFAE